jgi:hypothetical protein
MTLTVLATQEGELDAADKVSFEALKTRLAAGQSKVMLFLHGGLVNEADGRQQAVEVSNGLSLDPSWEQICVVWRTGLLEELRDNWLKLVNSDALYKLILAWLVHHAASKVKVTGAAGATLLEANPISRGAIRARFDASAGNPVADLEALATGPNQVIQVQETSRQEIEAELRAALQADPELQSALKDLNAAVMLRVGGPAGPGDAAAGAVSFSHLNGNIQQRLENSAARAIHAHAVTELVAIWDIVTAAAEVAWRVYDRYRTQRDHGFYATIVEELAREIFGDYIGGDIWDWMKQNAAKHFEPGGFGPQLIEALSQGANNNRLVVIGHSAGSIWASDFLTAVAKSTRPFPMDLVFVAGAVRVKDFAQALSSGEDHVRRFRAYAMTDATERADTLIQKPPGLEWVYPSSLLYLVSGLFEANPNSNRHLVPDVDAPLVGLQRFFETGAPPAWLTEADEIRALREVIVFYGKHDPATYYGPGDEGPGMNSSARDHGCYETDPDTLASIKYAFFADPPHAGLTGTTGDVAVEPAE